MTWTADNQLKTLKAKNSVTGDQTTTWVYGTTLRDSDVARNDLVRAKEFPDSWNNATVGSGNMVNEIEFAHDGFGLLTSEPQSHSGAVTGGTRKVQYAYTNGASNHARRTPITYPDSTVLALDYDSSGAVDDVLNRLKQLKFSYLCKIGSSRAVASRGSFTPDKAVCTQREDNVPAEDAGKRGWGG